MQAHTWWIDKPLVMGSSNPSSEDLAQFRVEGFSVIVSFLDEQKQPPNYEKLSAAAAGWSIYSISIEESGVPSLAQLSELITSVKAVPSGMRILMHCESGKGRTACMAAAYWIAKGLPADQAIGRMRQAASDEDWITRQRVTVLREFAQLQESDGTEKRGQR